MNNLKLGRPPKLMIVEDQTIFRDVLVEWLGMRGGFDIVGAHETAAEAEQTLKSHDVDVLLLDVRLPDEDGLAFLERLAKDNPRYVILITAHQEPWILKAAVTSRAHAIVMKGAPLTDLAIALDRVLTGETYYCRRTSELLRRTAVRPSPVDSITPREREILALVACGKTSKSIAKHLKIREKTVQNHRANIMEKLRLHDVASLTRFALDHGLVGQRDGSEED